MLKPFHLLGVLVVGAAVAGIALHGDPAKAEAAAPVPTMTVTPVAVSPSPASTDWVDNEAPLTDNALYQAGRVPAVGCRLPTARLASSVAVVAYARGMLTCLNRSWSSALTRAGFYFIAPDFTAYKDNVSSPCEGSGDAVAFYCSTDHKIYLNWADYVSKRRDEQPYVQGALMDVMAHEYGHHVQELVGIGAFYDDRYEQETGDAQLEDSRRMELQASCFGAAFLGADKHALGLVGERLFGLQDEQYSGDEPGDERDHGSATSNQHWTSAAFKSASPGSCNTWKAPATLVF
jgi:hypothetical protein